MLTAQDININEIPDSGWILAYFRKHLCFDRYNKIDGQIVLDNLTLPTDDETLLECHCFNQQFEYRLTASQTVEKNDVDKKDGIEKIIKADERSMPENEWKEEVVLLNERYQNVGKALKLINYLSFDENDCLSVKNFRLVEVLS